MSWKFFVGFILLAMNVMVYLLGRLRTKIEKLETRVAELETQHLSLH
jgi:hypothetical protein